MQVVLDIRGDAEVSSSVGVSSDVDSTEVARRIQVGR